MEHYMKKRRVPLTLYDPEKPGFARLVCKVNASTYNTLVDQALREKRTLLAQASLVLERTAIASQSVTDSCQGLHKNPGFGSTNAESLSESPQDPDMDGQFRNHSLKLPIDLYRYFTNRARKNRRTLNAELNLLLEREQMKELAL